ncbi:MAG: prolipoprotein diacylglyceryl transferase [Nitrospiraceae bacterium]|nr:prolipoprotein diacylglyceryl transferase [Nitrospiraceae bacterium]
MLPILFKLGPVPIHSYGLMIAIGFLVALHLITREAKARGIDPQIPSNLAFWCLILGVAGSRALHLIMFSEQYSWRDPIGWIAIWRGGLVFQGGLPLPILYCIVALRRYKVRFFWAADLVIPYVPLAHAFGRIGCFLNGCCYGKRSDIFWAIPFRRVPWDLAKPATGSPAFLDHCHRYAELSITTDHWSYPVHPTQLYSVVMLLAICVFLLYLRKKWNPVEGFILPAYLTAYGIGRFVIEMFRGDDNPIVFNLLTQQQAFCLVYIAIAIALCGVIFFIHPRKPTYTLN